MIVDEQNPSTFNIVTALVHTGKTVSGILFFYYYDISMKLHSYVYYQRLHIVTKNHYSDYSSSGAICS